MKKTSFGSRPRGAGERLTPDEWVNDRDAGEPMKRLTIDVPLTLHKRMKSRCAADGAKMADIVRDMLQQRFGTDSSES